MKVLVRHLAQMSLESFADKLRLNVLVEEVFDHSYDLSRAAIFRAYFIAKLQHVEHKPVYVRLCKDQPIIKTLGPSDTIEDAIDDLKRTISCHLIKVGGSVEDEEGWIRIPCMVKLDE